jgi:hypothetical protein
MDSGVVTNRAPVLLRSLRRNDSGERNPMSSMSENCAVENQNIFLLRDGFPFMERCGHKKTQETWIVSSFQILFNRTKNTVPAMLQSTWPL